MRRRAHRGSQPGVAAPEHIGAGRFAVEPRAALRAFGRIYAGWALSQDFYRAGLHLASGVAGNLGAADLESFLHRDWEQRFGALPAADLYAQLKTWDAADIGANALYDGDLARALQAIAAANLVDAAFIREAVRALLAR
ncbi:MAG: hypothetical protein HYX63_16000 [Gammaproteobacteria bacterium]|nr:hypothetical protein [Gammaproteobacteria bacterium]